MKKHFQLKLAIVGSILLGLVVGANAQTTTFNYTGAVQTYTVPAGITSLSINLQGAIGGWNSDMSSYVDSGGHGACVQATLSVTPGQTLYIYVGQHGTPGSTSTGGSGGYNGGGNGANAFGAYGGGGGGGATDIRVGGTSLTNRVLVAGGGGGAALNYTSYNSEKGGDGGGLTGENGWGNSSPSYGYGGFGGTPLAGGNGGSYSFYTSGTSGTLGTGGDGGSGTSGGGGGGGYYGAGGGCWAGGGGGSSYTDPTLASSATHTRGCNMTSDGIVSITPLAPCSGTVTAGSATASPTVGGMGTSFSLGLSGSTIGSGLTYQWYSSPDGITWTIISGATSASYSFTGLSVNTYFECIETCASSSSSSTSSSVLITYALTPTCLPTSGSWSSESGNVVYGIDALTISGYSGSTLTDASMTSTADGTTGYLDRTSSIAAVDLQQGGTYSASATWGSASSYQELQVWIDFNDDGTFQVSEEVSPVSGWSSGSTISPTNFNINIPVTAPVGVHLMRVRGNWENISTTLGYAPSDLDPCAINYLGGNPYYYSGDIIDYHVNIVFLPACTGTPTAGTATSTASLACPSLNFTLGLSGSTLATSLTYQWQSSPDGSTWTNISGATSNSYLTSESAATYYRCYLICGTSTLSDTSTTIFVPYISGCYCSPSFSSASYGCTSLAMDIAQFNVTGELSTTINDLTGCNGTTDYEDNSSIMSAEFYQGNTYTATIASGTYSYNLSAQAWIDFNDNGTFETSESVGGIASFYAYGATFNLAVPISANVGSHRMRVVANYFSCCGGASYPYIDPCASGVSYGDAHDYTIIIASPPPCTGTPTAGTATTTLTTACPSLAFSLNLTGSSVASGIAYQWQSSPDGTTWTDISGATSVPFTTTESASSYYRCYLTCTSLSVSDTSTIIHVNYISACYCTPTYSYASYSCSYGYSIGSFTVSGEASTSISDYASCNSTGYLDNTTLSVSFYGGVSYSASINNTSYDYMNAQVWIDFDDDGTFASSESVGGSNDYYNYTTFSLAIPSGTTLGSHRMRVVTDYYYGDPSSPSIDPCVPYYTYGETRDYMVNIIAPPPCSGTPTAGTCATTSTSACPSLTFTLSLPGGTIASGINYQWQSSPDGSTWSAISGATSSTYSTMESVSTYYRCYLVCSFSSLSDTSTSILINYYPGCYCTPYYYSASYSCTYGYGISSYLVTGESSTAINDYSSCNGTGYLDNTSAMSVSFYPGTTYSASISNTSYDYMNVQVWIDFDDDGTFATSESVGGSNDYYLSSTFSMVMPSGATLGNHRMRVVTSWYYTYSSYPSMDPCTSGYSYGETRDYTANIIPPPPCSGSPVAGTIATTATAACPSLTFTLSLPTATIASGLNYQWQSSPDGSTWTSISGATDATYSTTESATTYYRCYLICSFSTLSDTSSSAIVYYYPGCYCTPSYVYSNPGIFDALSNFSLTGYSGSIINDNGPTTVPTSGYEDETSTISVNLRQGDTYSGSITYTTNWREYEDQVWIDFNDNGTFETSEEVTSDFGVTGCSTYGSSASFTLTIPLTANPGWHRMRVRQAETYNCTPETHMDPCNPVSSFTGDNYYYGVTRDYMADIIPLPGCTGAPTAGTATSSVTLACPSLSFTLALAGTSAASSINYQWQSSPDGTTWTNISGATVLPFITTETTSTYYRCYVICTTSSLSDTSTSVYVPYISGCYCTPTYLHNATSCSSYNMFINPFQLTGFSGAINDLTSCSGTGYEDETSMSCSLQTGTSYTANIGTGTSYHLNCQVWIDFNDNGTFESSESVGGMNYYIGSTNSLGITIPSGVALGNHRMRVVSVYSYVSYPSISPCPTGSYPYNYGDARDYTVNIVPICSFSLSATNSGPVCPGTTLNLTGTTTATGYSWSGPSGYTSTLLSPSISGFNNPGTYTFTCTDGTCTTFVTTTVTMNSAFPAPTVSPAFDTICNNTTAMLSVTPSTINLLPTESWETGVPDTWTILSGGTGTAWFQVAGSSTSLPSTGGAPTGGGTYVAEFNSYSISTGGNSTLCSPVFSVAGTNTNTVSFWMYRDPGYAGDYLEGITIYQNTTASITGATSLGFVPRWNGAPTTGSVSGVSSPTSAGWYQYTCTITGTSTTNYIMLYAYSEFGNNIFMDLVSITGTPNAPTWSPTTAMFTDAGLTTPYVAGTAIDTVYVHPTTVTSTVVTNTYYATISNGTCYSTDSSLVTINPTPSAISGPSSVCMGSTVTLSDVTSSGTWSSSNTSVATITSTGGLLTPIAVGTDTITYTLPTGCITTTIITVNALPSAISGIGAICVGNSLTVSDISTGGTWSTSSTSATIGSGTGIVTGTSAGIATITYTLSTGCAVNANITVNPNPSSISGTLTVCTSFTTLLSDATSGGTWNMSNGNATQIGGLVTGVSAGIDTISYTLTTTGCTTSSVITINATPAAISGIGAICIGNSLTVSDISTGGTWSTSSTSATIGTGTGIVTGTSAGIATITYTLSTGCSVNANITVNPNPSAISGTLTVCTSSTTSLSDATIGGTWNMSNAHATQIGGLVTGVSAGIDTISYTLTTTGCTTSSVITINATPAAISGADSLCSGYTITWSDASTGGTWSTSGTMATIGSSTGVISSLSAGTQVITYSLSTGCSITKTVTINAQPAAISGTTTVCTGLTTTLSDSVSGGSWSSFFPSIATIGSTGIVTGVSAGSDIITYTLPTGCYAVAMFNVNTTPTLSSSLTPPAICDSTLFSYAPTSTTGGTAFTWSRATVAGITNPSSSGRGNPLEILINSTPNPIVVTYVDTLIATGCLNIENVTVTVNPKPMLSSSLTTTAICDSTLFTYLDSSLTAGTTYSWSRATVSGISNPAASGIGNIIEYLSNTTSAPVLVTYIDTLIANGCWNTENISVTVNPKPILSSTLTPAAICDSTLFSYTSASTTAGTTYAWSRATVTGISNTAGNGVGNPNEILINTTTDTVSVIYIDTLFANGCMNTQSFVVVVNPKPVFSGIDTGSICSGTTFSYTPASATTGTTYAWMRPGVTGISPLIGAGTTTISETLTNATLLPIVVSYVYTLTANACTNTENVTLTVNPAPSASIITKSPASLCLNTMNQNFGTSAPPATVVYTWTAANANVWGEGTNHQYCLINFNNAGNAMVYLTANVAGISCYSKDSFAVSVGTTTDDVPGVIYYAPQFICLTAFEDSYQWGYDDALTLDSTLLVGETSQNYTNASPDFTNKNYWVITTKNGCMQKTYNNAPAANIKNINNDKTVIKIYPNPAEEIVTVDINTTVLGDIDVDVLNMMGQKLGTQRAINHEARINVSQLASGFYMIDCYRDGIKIGSARLIKN